jgi:hypothetical protein
LKPDTTFGNKGRNGGIVSIFIIALIGLWILAAVAMVSQIARLWNLNPVLVGAMTIAQAVRASRRGAIIAFVALATLSWPLWLEISVWDRAVFRDGKLVRIFDSGAVMLQGTWDKTTAGAEVVSLLSGVVGVGTVVEMPCPKDGSTNGVLVITIDGKNDRDSTLKRLEYGLTSGMRMEMIGYPPFIVKKVVGESSQWDSLCQTAKKLSDVEKGDGTSRIKAKQEVLEIAETISKDLWSRFGIRIIDVDYR